MDKNRSPAELLNETDHGDIIQKLRIWRLTKMHQHCYYPNFILLRKYMRKLKNKKTLNLSKRQPESFSEKDVTNLAKFTRQHL